ncbi:P-loop NTPase fold protein [Tenacibaculum finnmarkense]|uniref:P-loop NTPase fold protein n=1 Tax=Tenacibaculum finnmarkense TaxID=2781243 RepID=UPI001E516301|nr:P-loop NTPase fold protein [Tenacibaculum finnmarkense]MCD8403834.1 NTPase KAP [Tenacibaculum finnmarkense genomovar finnmarkense]
MKTEHLKTIFTNYLIEPKTQYAILINGTWGSGKTYYWKNELTETAKNNGYKAIYITLNGISSTEVLERTLFYKLIPFIGDSKNKYIKNITKLIGNSANAVSKFFTKSDFNDLFKGVGLDSFDFEKYVICFDDLERCQIPIKETLGFINNYTEHKFLKTIIFADENNIDNSQEGYDNIKEKVIGRILNFELDINESISLLINNYKEEKIEFHDFLIQNKELISNIFVDCNQNNLRITSFYFRILETLHPIIKDSNNQFIREIILFSALIAIEFKLGKLKSNEHNEPKGIEHIDKHFPHLFNLNSNIGKPIIEDKKDEPEKSFARIFYDTYLTDRINEYFFYSSIFTFILSGYLDENKLKGEIENRSPEIISDEIKSFRQLLSYHFRELSNEDFGVLPNKVLKYSKEGKYSIYDYVQIANFFYFFSENNILDISIKEIDENIEEGLKKAKLRKEINDRRMSNLMHFGDADVRITKIKKKVKNIHNEIKKEFDIKEANELIIILKEKDETALTAFFAKYNVSDKVFKNIDKVELCSAITKATNNQLFNFNDVLKQRYESVNIGQYLFDDFEILNDLKNKLTEKSSSFKIQPQKFLIEELLKTLEEICTHLNNTKK